MDEGTGELLKRILNSTSYRLAMEDAQFLERDELRAIRFGLELLKPELIQQELGIRSTIVVFGSSRIVSREAAEREHREAEAVLARSSADPKARAGVRRAERKLAMSRFYDEAREFGRIVSSTCQTNGLCEFVIVTGGGPGIMEAANRGAHDVGAKSVGLNISLPHEQLPNPYITPELCFQFHYFAARKMHFLLRAKALVAFPGGFGTLDELFGTLTLLQTGKMPNLPVVLVGRAYWEEVVDWPLLVEDHFIDEGDLGLMHMVETAQEAWEHIWRFHVMDRVAAPR